MLIKIVKKFKRLHWRTLLLVLSLAYGSDDSKKNLSEDERLAFQYVEKGNLNELKNLIKQKEINLEMTDADGNTLIHIAIQQFQQPIIEYLASLEALNPNILNNKDLGPLHLAIERENEEEAKKIVKCLLAHKNIDPNLQATTGFNEYTPLHKAIKKGYKEIVQWLLDKKVKLNLRSYGNTPLYLAARIANKDIFQLLLLHGEPRPDLQKDYLGSKLLKQAIEAGNKEVVSFLLGNQRINPYLPSPIFKDNVWSVLHHAIDYDLEDSGEMVKLLLTYNQVNPNLQDQNKDTPLWFAFKMEKSKNIEVLLNSGRVDPNIQKHGPFYKGNTLLHDAVEKKDKKVVEMLLESKNLKPNKTNKNGDTALHIAAQNGDGEIIELLLKDKRVRADIKNNAGNGAIHVAVEREQKQAVIALLKYDKVNPNLKDNFGDTPLNNAVQQSGKEMMELLLKKASIDPNITDNKGKTPLMHAFSLGLDQDKFKQLLNHPRNDPQKVALSIDQWIQAAEEDNDQTMIKLLKNYRKEQIVNSTASNDSENDRQGLSTNTSSTSPQNSNLNKCWDQTVLAGVVIGALIATVGGCYAIIYHLKNRKKR